MTLKITADNIDLGTLTSVTGPKITLVDYPGDDLATLPAGGATVAIVGTGFVNGCQVLVDSVYAPTVTFVSSSAINFTTPAMSAGTYPIYVINPDGGTAIAIPGISYSGVPAFSTGSGSIGSVYESSSFSSNIVATSDSAITYTIDSGALPAGFSLNANTGTITGNAGSVTNSTTYNFTVKANDAELQDTTRNFSITLNPDVVTFNTPAGNQTYSNITGNVFSLTLDATSAAGKTVSYTANTLPGGITLSGNVISGTFNAVSSAVSLITATAATTLKTATRLLTWAVTSPTTPTVDFLVVAGGGSGWGGYSFPGPGGGAGGYRTSVGTSGGGSTAESQLSTPTGTTLTVTVGAGGTTSFNSTSGSGSGTNSALGSIISIGGGGAATNIYTGPEIKYSGKSGGSGGGGFNPIGTAGGPGEGTAGQGYAGGQATGQDQGANAAGGGGAGGVGGNVTGANPWGGIGGVGVTSSITGTSVGYAGGGGGSGYVSSGNANAIRGAASEGGGSGGGGSLYGSTGNPGTANTGGGGGGSGGSAGSGGGSGGSGIVVIRYADTYPVAASTTGSPTVTVSGGYRVYKFTSSGSITF